MKLLHSIAIALAACAGAAFAEVPAGYPADYAKVVDAARKGGKVVVYGVLGNKAAAPLVAGFKALYPDIEVAYDGDGGSNEVNERFLGEVKRGQPSAEKIIGDAIELFAVRDDVDAEYTAAKLANTIGSVARPIPLDPKISAALDDKRQREFILNWKTELQAK